MSDGDDWSGLHKARWRYRYDWERNDIGDCKPANVTVLIRSVITMPHLLNAASIQADLRQEWVEYIAALRVHEEGHREITRQQLLHMREELLAVPFRPCSDFPEALQPITDRNQAEVRRQQKAYDAETEHGRTQGANWPPRGGETTS